ncbi:hypothetical protein [Mesorhizobium huakuii]|uniref:Uncharacterized protein n=1 Tax=Mesorhizobium huakuii TaxID=28104 RepID=A0A7G6T0W8_9HYPH|nr:hypothetical protein [Mesorhizobium huakuii]QND60400.1 hypothetical protein HB778_30525 [Mesorhizobium huakuii]
MAETPVFTRAAIAEMVAPDYELLRSHINPNLPLKEAGDAWDSEMNAILVSRATAIGIQNKEEFRQFLNIYYEEQAAFFTRRQEQNAFNHQMHNTVARTVVRASIWSMIFQIFR